MNIADIFGDLEEDCLIDLSNIELIKKENETNIENIDFSSLLVSDLDCENFNLSQFMDD